MGLANAISRLKDSKAKSKVVILLTDGSNNMGDLSPMTAAEIARSFGIRIYTIGVGTDKLAPYPKEVAGQIQYVYLPVEILERQCGEAFGQIFKTITVSLSHFIVILKLQGNLEIGFLFGCFTVLWVLGSF